MKEIIDKILEDAKSEIASAKLTEVESIKYKYIGRKSELGQILKSLGKLEIQERKEVGAKANQAQKEINELIFAKESAGNISNNSRSIDVTAPGRKYEIGHIHPINKIMDELLSIFTSLGYEIIDGPEVEDDWHNFEALNMHADHPARDMQDTFYLVNGNLPRTHTSPVQIRYMEQNKPPIRIVSPGKVHRNENEDATHSWVFHQIEGLVVEKNITLGDLKGTLEMITKQIFGPNTKTRFRPNFFPYTEPSAEMDASCPHCEGKGCRSCGGTGWLELLGSGMVHPQVLINMGIDPEEYNGFAFGLGVERIAMIKYGIPDVRYFWHPDTRFLEQF